MDVVSLILFLTLSILNTTYPVTIMNFLTTYEAPLRSYIQARIALLESALEEEVRNRDNVDITLLEQQFDRESDNFIAGITRRSSSNS